LISVNGRFSNGGSIMKKAFLAGFLLFLCAEILHAQGELRPEWVLRYPSDVPTGDAEAWGIDIDAQGNLYWATSQFRPVIGGFFDIVVYKLDPDGKQLWTAPSVYGGFQNQQAYIARVYGDRLYVAGRDCRANGCDMLVLAIEPDTGDTLWSMTWDRAANYEEADDVLAAADGLYITGWCTGETSRQDVGLLKLDLNGRLQWSNTWGGEWGEHADGHAVLDAEGIYIAGLFNGTGLLNNMDGRALAASFARSDGTLMDSVTFGRDDQWLNMENALGMVSDGTWLYVVGPTTVAAGDWDIFLSKYDKNFNLVWRTEWGGDAVESSRAIALGDDGSIYVAGETTSFGAGDADVVVIKFAPNGAPLLYRTWGAAGEDHALDIAVRGAQLYLTGLTRSFHPEQKKEALLLKVNVDSLATDVHSTTEVLPAFTLDGNYPDPFASATTIRFRLPSPETVELALLNALGQPVRTLMQQHLPAGAHQVRVMCGDLPQGVYFCRMRAGSAVALRKMLLLK
jgi:hypothetical protein